MSEKDKIKCSQDSTNEKRIQNLSCTTRWQRWRPLYKHLFFFDEGKSSEDASVSLGKETEAVWNLPQKVAPKLKPSGVLHGQIDWGRTGETLIFRPRALLTQRADLLAKRRKVECVFSFVALFASQPRRIPTSSDRDADTHHPADHHWGEDPVPLPRRPVFLQDS